MKKNDNIIANKKQKRKQFIKMFYKNNKILYGFTIIVLLTTSIMVVGISYLLQVATDIALAGNSSEILKLSVLTVGVICLLTMNWMVERSIRNRYIKKALVQYKTYVFSRITKKI